ncbi:DUF262 domain-containing protein [Paraburkholderia fungorum]|uniref:DUF262 domain-containing protein n=1 Tax=Paraburkholderia fungorum TaxID=134537 RepID=UPI0038BCE3C9
MSAGDTFGVIRLGRDSVDAIVKIDEFKTLKSVDFEINLQCSQVPSDLGPGSIVFIWLGSDNSKGLDTPWEKGLRAIGTLVRKEGGPTYRDQWALTFKVRIVLPRSLSHRDYLGFGSTYAAFSDIPIIGLNTFSNQLAQLINPGDRRDVRALLFTIGALIPSFQNCVASVYPSLTVLLDYSPDVTEQIPGSAPAASAEADSEINELEYPEGLQPTTSDYDPYPIDSVFVRAEPRTVFEVLRRINGKTYILNPSFQRDFVWDENKQSKFIESAMMRIPLPPFYLSERLDGKVVVVDGLQRLTTFQRFVDGRFKLQGLTGFGHKYNGTAFYELPETLKARIEDAPLTLYLIDARVTERARLDIFERVNSGVPLTRQQMRNALYNGIATEFLRTAASGSALSSASGNSLRTPNIIKQMRDREIVNRFCAFLLLGPEEYRGDMDAFLGGALDLMNQSGVVGIEALNARFIRAMQNNRLIFAQHAFRKHTSPNQSRSVINVALFEVMSVALADVDTDVALEKADAVRKGFYKLMLDDSFRDSISLGTSDAGRVRTRFSLALNEIGAAIND